MGNLTGVRELTEQLLALGKLEVALPAATRKAMRPVLEEARRTVPISKVPTHRLTATYGKQLVTAGYAQRHLRIVTERMKGGSRTSTVVSESKRAFYTTVFEEFGTRYIRPMPWLRKAFYSQRAAMEVNFKESLERSLLKAIKK